MVPQVGPDRGGRWRAIGVAVALALTGAAGGLVIRWPGRVVPLDPSGTPSADSREGTNHPGVESVPASSRTGGDAALGGMEGVLPAPSTTGPAGTETPLAGREDLAAAHREMVIAMRREGSRRYVLTLAERAARRLGGEPRQRLAEFDPAVAGPLVRALATRIGRPPGTDAWMPTLDQVISQLVEEPARGVERIVAGLFEATGEELECLTQLAWQFRPPPEELVRRIEAALAGDDAAARGRALAVVSDHNFDFRAAAHRLIPPTLRCATDVSVPERARAILALGLYRTPRAEVLQALADIACGSESNLSWIACDAICPLGAGAVELAPRLAALARTGPEWLRPRAFQALACVDTHTARTVFMEVISRGSEPDRAAALKMLGQAMPQDRARDVLIEIIQRGPPAAAAAAAAALGPLDTRLEDPRTSAALCTAWTHADATVRYGAAEGTIPIVALDAALADCVRDAAESEDVEMRGRAFNVLARLSASPRAAGALRPLLLRLAGEGPPTLPPWMEANKDWRAVALHGLGQMDPAESRTRAALAAALRSDRPESVRAALRGMCGIAAPSPEELADVRRLAEGSDRDLAQRARQVLARPTWGGVR